MISFCISTLKNNNIENIIQSINKQNIQQYEILIDNSMDKLTIKKNRMINNAKYENLVIMHDYYKLSDNWYQEFQSELSDWNVLMSKIINTNGNRFRDWCIWDDPEYGNPWMQYEPWCSSGRLNMGQPQLAPYNYNKTQYMYVSGGFWIAKKQFMIDNPLNESLDWGQAEDVEWSIRARKKWKYKLNNSTVNLIKYKDLII